MKIEQIEFACPEVSVVIPAFNEAAGIEPVKRPDSRLDRELLLRRAVGHVIAVGDAMTVSDDQGRSAISFSLAKGLHCLQHLCAKRDARYAARKGGKGKKK